MKFPIFLFALLMVFNCSFSSFGQDKPFALFTEDDGLANNDVRDIIKDNAGYLWIGTSSGLSKYDGQKFTNFQVQQGLPGKWVWSVEKDDKNRIYAGCYSKGLAIIENDKVTKILHLEANVKNKFRRLHYSNSYKLMLVGTDYGLYALKDTTFILLSYPNAPTQKSSVLSITEYEGYIYFTVHNDTKNGGFFKLELNDKDISKSIVTKIMGGGQGFGSSQIDGKIFFSINNRICEYSPKSNTVDEVLQTDEQFSAWAMAKVSSKVIGLGGFGDNMFQSGLKLLNVSNHTLTQSPPGFEVPSINQIYYDEELNSPWIGSTEGLYCLYQSPFSFWNMANQSEAIKDVVTIENSIFILTDKNIWEIKSGRLSLFKTKTQVDEIISKKADRYFFNKNVNVDKLTIYTLYETIMKGKSIIPLQFIMDNGKYYLITSYGTVSFPDLDRYLPIPHGQFSTDNETGNVLWIPAYGKFRYFKSISTSLEIPYFQTNQNIDIKDIFKIIKSGKIIYFASTFNGLFALKGKDAYTLNSKNSTFDDNLSGVDIDNEGNLWSTSFDGKLYQIKFDGQLLIAKTYDNRNSEIIGSNFKWLKFNKQYLYIGTNKGLNKIPLSQLKNNRIDTVYFYNKYNGYDFISAESAAEDSLGNIYVYDAHRVIKISNDTLSPEKQAINFQGINIDGQEYSFDQLNNMNLSSKTENINIRFSVLKFPQSNNIEYRYKLNNNSWKSDNLIELQSIKPGDYTVVSEAYDKERSERFQKVIRFKINPYYWQSPWFIIITSLIIISIGYWILHFRFKQQKKKHDEQSQLTKEIADLQIMSLQAQMNPHFVFNSLNSIQLYILSNKTTDAAFYLSTLGKIIRMNLENISQEYILLSVELKFLENYIEIEKMRFKEILNTSLTNHVLNVDKILLPPMLIQPLIENSIKHGIRLNKNKGLINIDFSISDKCLVVTVTDNGIGREKSSENKIAQHKSFGLDLIYGRLALLNQKNKTDKFRIEITDLFEFGNSTGTKVELVIPQHGQKIISKKRT